MKQALIIIPTYNEAENIGRLISELFAHEHESEGWTYSILVVDDNSPDGTADLVRGLIGQTQAAERLQLISGKKAGLGKAYIRGFREGIQQEMYDAFIMMDADFSHDPKSIPSLLTAIDEGADYVIGSRYIHGGSIPGNWPIRRIINSRIANFIAHFLTDIDKSITDVTGGFKAIRVSVLKQIDLRSIPASGYVFQVSLVYEFVRRGAVIREVPISFIDREFGDSKLRWGDITEFIHRTYKLNPDSRPSRFIRFGIVGFIGTLINLAVLSFLVRNFDMSVFVAVTVAIEASIISNFFMNHYFTFHAGRPGSRHEKVSDYLIPKLVIFNFGALGGALISFATFAFLHSQLGIHYIAADIIAILLAVVWNFWMSTKLVWKTSPKQQVLS